MKRLFLYIFLFYTALLQAQGGKDAPAQKSSYLDTMGAPSAIVAGSVDVIRGEFVHSAVDLVVPGAEPIVIDRYYSRGDPRRSSYKDVFRRDWLLGNLGFIEWYRARPGEEQVFYVLDSQGFGATYEGNIDYYVKNTSYRWTNYSTGKISGQTHVRNRRLNIPALPNNPEHLLDEYVNPTLFTGSGSFQVFRAQKRHPSTRMYDLWMERKPHGNLFEYGYDKHRRPTHFRTLNGRNQPLAHVFFKYSPDHGKRVCVEGGGRSVFYSYGKHMGMYCLKAVDRSDGWSEKFTYNSFFALARKEFPAGRFVEAEYYKEGKNEVGNALVKLKYDDLRIGRVKLLKAPAGHDGSPVVTHRFFYDGDFTGADVYRPREMGGTTGVYDAMGHLTNYVYNSSGRLTDIIQCQGPALYCVEHYRWHLDGNLISQSFSDVNGTLCSRYLQYDSRGNIVEEQQHGDFSGTNTSSIVIDGNGVPHGGEVLKKHYVYSDDGFNLLLQETDHRKKTTYTYYPQTDLVKTCFVEGSFRQFFEYDDNACLSLEIVDNGTSLDREDLTGATERHIKRIWNQQRLPIGLPEIIEENAFDFQTGSEKRIRKTVNHYNEKGNRIRQDIYGSDDVHAYSLYWEYDMADRVTKAVDALGQTTTYCYDLHGNKIRESGPASHFYRHFEYDFANRLIKEEDVYDNGIRLSKSYRYDYLGHCIASSDIQGNETYYIYNEHGHLIETRYPGVLDSLGPLINPSTKSEYNAMGHPVLFVDARGIPTYKKFNIRGQVSAVFYPMAPQNALFTP